ncbi:MAG: hypothetical protein ACJAYJ_004651 [Saprospiraceae bacterium]|jgi:hypothetical protein
MGFNFLSLLSAEGLLFFSDLDSIRKEKAIWINAQDTILLKPVCGVDGNTYVNADEAHFYGIQEWTEGRCNSYEKVIVQQPDQIWLTEVFLNDFSQESDYEKSGYSNFTNVIFEISPSKKNQLKYQTNDGGKSNQNFKVWIDFDGDYKFEKEELIIDQKVSKKDEFLDFSIPSNLEIDFITQMRVFYGFENSHPEKGYISVGEVEDYTVMVGR